MFFSGGSYYYIIIGLQVCCALHSYRRGTLNRWIFLIIFLPVIGCVIYIYSEILSNRRSFRSPNIDVSAVLNPGGRIKKLEDELRFTDTFTNKVKLADAYLAGGFTDKAIELYNASLTGAFSENEHVLGQLVIAYFEQQRYDEVIPIAKKIYKLPQFTRSKAHILYAKSLEFTGNIEQAEIEFKAMKGRYSYFGPRYEYGLFLMRAGREKEAREIFEEMLNEEQHLSAMERKSNRAWFAKVKDQIRKIGSFRDSA
ncbi:MAG TPA: hypothetical protein VGI43_10000 [Mucilaginibacter sp.]|jgi:hypothetical protein